MAPAALITFIYAALVFIGGLIGFKAGSIVSLVTSTITAIVLLNAGIGLKRREAWGYPLAVAAMIAMTGFGIYRYIETTKIMPPLGIAALSFVALLGVLITKGK